MRDREHVFLRSPSAQPRQRDAKASTGSGIPWCQRSPTKGPGRGSRGGRSRLRGGQRGVLALRPVARRPCTVAYGRRAAAGRPASPAPPGPRPRWCGVVGVDGDTGGCPETSSPPRMRIRLKTPGFRTRIPHRNPSDKQGPETPPGEGGADNPRFREAPSQVPSARLRLRNLRGVEYRDLSCGQHFGTPVRSCGMPYRDQGLSSCIRAFPELKVAKTLVAGRSRPESTLFTPDRNRERRRSCQARRGGSGRRAGG